MLHVAEFRTMEKLSSLRATWQKLWEKTPRSSFQQSYDWFTSFIENWGSDQAFRVLVVTVASKPIGIVPLIVETTESRLGTIRSLKYPISGWGTYYGVVGPHPAATLAAAMRHLQQSKRDWETIELTNIDNVDSDRERTRNAMRNCGFRPLVQDGPETLAIELPGDWETFVEENQRQHKRYQDAEQVLSRDGDIEWIRFRPGTTTESLRDYRWDLFNDFCRLLNHQSRPAVCGQSNIDVKRVRRFLSDLHVWAVESQSVDMAILTCDSEPVAAAYNYVSIQGMENIAIATADHCPQAQDVLWGRMIRESIELADFRILLATPNESGAAWSNSTAVSQSCTHFAALAPRSQLLRLNTIAQQWPFFKSAAASKA